MSSTRAYLTRDRQRIDYLGIGLLAVGIGSLQIVLDKGQQEDWFSSRVITTLAVLSALGLVAFVIARAGRREPDRGPAGLQATAPSPRACS